MTRRLIGRKFFIFLGGESFIFLPLFFTPLIHPSFNNMGIQKKVDTIIDGNNKSHLKAVNKGNKCCRTLGQGYRLRKCVSPL
jgi:hypothetical protein